MFNKLTKKYIITLFIVCLIIYYLIFNKIIPDNTCIKYNYDNILNKNININKISHNLIYITDIFKDDCFNKIQEISTHIRNSNIKDNRNFLRKNTTLSSDKLKNTYINDIYFNKNLLDFLSTQLDKNLNLVDCSDISSMNLISYNKPNDYIYWHKDPNHYFGNRYTVLIMTKNTSTVKLMYKLNNEIFSLNMEENSILIFDGSKIEHRTTPLEENEERDLLSFTYCDDCNTNRLNNISVWIKNTLLGY